MSSLLTINGFSMCTPAEKQPIWLTWQWTCHYFLLYMQVPGCVHFCLMCVCVRAKMRPVCLLLSQIAPMRAPKITTKSTQWVGWKPCHQPFLHTESPPLLYLWVTPHTSHGDRKGRQYLVFDRHKCFHMLMRLLLAFSRGQVGSDCELNGDVVAITLWAIWYTRSNYVLVFCF